MNKIPHTSSFPWKRESRLLSFSFVIASVAKQSLFLSLRYIIKSFPSHIRGINIQRKSRVSSFSLVFANPLKLMKQFLFLSWRETIRIATISVFFALPSFAFAENKIPVFPSTPVEVYAIYGTVALFWLGIIGLIVIIKMKLNEIERIQKLGIDEEDINAPFLD